MPANADISRRVYCLGETVLDLVSEDGVNMRAVPGGSVLNAAVSLGRMNIPVHLLSEFGNDKAGDIIDQFLGKNHVDTRFCIRHKENKTSLALAFLDSQKKASYTFYHDTPEDLMLVDLPDFTSEDILLFGSFYAVKPDRRKLVLQVLQKAVEANSVIYYDLNIRKAHAGEQEKMMDSFMNNIAAATIIKGSDEDFLNLFGLSDPDAVYEKVSRYCRILIITNGSKPALVYMPGMKRSYQVREITPVSTIGAGDNFNAGFIYGLATSGVNARNISGKIPAEIDRMVACGLAFAADTCLSADNYITRKFEPDFWKQYI
jgi:fructokinase